MHVEALDGETLDIATVVSVADHWEHPERIRVVLTPEAALRTQHCRKALERLMERREIVYGVTTGFGAFKNRIITAEQSAQLQRNLLMSHAVGVGPPLSERIVRAVMLIRANTLARGHSGIRLAALQALLELLNRGVHPVIPAQGSVGASGDLAPLAHMALVLIGQGEAIYRGERMGGADALQHSGLEPTSLVAKEALALVNGTTVMSAIGALVTARAHGLLQTADVIASLSLEALHGSVLAYDARLHALRPHPGQIECAAHLRRLLEGSELVRRELDASVQDAYTLRCIPQVHGAVRSVIAHAQDILQIEINSATDNPLFFHAAGEDTALSGGNFHGEPLALAMDYLGLALTDLGNMSERRIARLLDADSNGGVLPPFLTERGGLHSGYMMLQYTAAALASENKVLAHPASADSIPTSANAEDHVSMGATAARKAQQIIEHVETIFALELLCAAQGIDFRLKETGPLRLGHGTHAAYQAIRAQVPFVSSDQVLHPHIQSAMRIVQGGRVALAAERALAAEGS